MNGILSLVQVHVNAGSISWSLWFFGNECAVKMGWLILQNKQGKEEGCYLQLEMWQLQGIHILQYTTVSYKLSLQLNVPKYRN